LKGASRFPLKCYCCASKSALQNSITAAIGAVLRKNFIQLSIALIKPKVYNNQKIAGFLFLIVSESNAGELQKSVTFAVGKPHVASSC